MTNTKNQTPLITQLLATWIEGEESQGLATANYANAAAILMQNVPDINWAGFYFYQPDQDLLTLGPFVGKPATVKIGVGAGVVGTAFQKRETIVVPDVKAFAGHIVCDPLSASEIVVPLVTATGKLLGVLDIDSPKVNRFSHDDQVALESFTQTLLTYVD